MSAAVPAPTVIDLFAGAGGLSLGAARAGFRVAAAVELDKQAYETHKRNFPSTVHLQRDVASLTGKELLELAGVPVGKLAGVIGGPPCQGFSSMGKNDVDDERNQLFGHFFRLVAEARPQFFVAENVPNIQQPKYKPIIDAALKIVEKDYRLLSPVIVKANEYGAPTVRKRVFFIGVRRDLSCKIDEFDFVADPNVQLVTVNDALEGLPVQIDASWQLEEQGIRPVGPMRDSEFAKRVSGMIPEGVGDPKVIKLYREESKVYGCLGTRHGEEQAKRYGELKHGQKDQRSKAVRLNPVGFCPTLRAGTGSDKGSHQAVRPIHPVEARVITPREAARLQGFPDWFVFHETKWHSFRQIGNSVSPIISEYILSRINGSLHDHL
jgi:DNA (cytosine-5)-methyltransferase 1